MPGILINTPNLQLPGGVANYYRVLRLDLEPDIDYFDIGSGERTRMAKLRRLASALVRFPFAARRASLVVLNPSLLSNAFLRDAIFALVVRLSGAKLVVFWRGWDWDFYEVVRASSWRRALFRLSFGQAYGCMFLGESFVAGARGLGLRADAQIVRETTVADDSALRISPAELATRHEGRRLRLLFMSRLDRNKGHVTAIDVLERVRNHIPDAVLVIAGDGPELAAARGHARDKGLQDAVQFCGYVSGADKHSLLLDSTMLLFPTEYGEGLPNVVLEAFLYGLPVIVGARGGIPDIVRNGVNGFVCESSDAQEYARHIVSLYRDPVVLHRVALANAERARAEFCTSAVRPRVLQQLRALAQ